MIRGMASYCSHVRAPPSECAYHITMFVGNREHRRGLPSDTKRTRLAVIAQRRCFGRRPRQVSTPGSSRSLRVHFIHRPPAARLLLERDILRRAMTRSRKPQTASRSLLAAQERAREPPAWHTFTGAEDKKFLLSLYSGPKAKFHFGVEKGDPGNHRTLCESISRGKSPSSRYPVPGPATQESSRPPACGNSHEARPPHASHAKVQESSIPDPAVHPP